MATIIQFPRTPHGKNKDQEIFAEMVTKILFFRIFYLGAVLGFFVGLLTSISLYLLFSNSMVAVLCGITVWISIAGLVALLNLTGIAITGFMFLIHMTTMETLAGIEIDLNIDPKLIFKLRNKTTGNGRFTLPILLSAAVSAWYLSGNWIVGFVMLFVLLQILVFKRRRDKRNKTGLTQVK